MPMIGPMCRCLNKHAVLICQTDSDKRYPRVKRHGLDQVWSRFNRACFCQLSQSRRTSFCFFVLVYSPASSQATVILVPEIVQIRGDRNSSLFQTLSHSSGLPLTSCPRVLLHAYPLPLPRSGCIAHRWPVGVLKHSLGPSSHPH
ncbi:hypothetical protein FA13DRAFT_904752 [Coprinellus micaceus]|uniref:Uncharacterized protein n=1 Tax=Coprinellus micaceus TaxID=71717 RepID=A0A4Y7TU54_COPMI|nr:hypothetical protein FA13DRAFT_904752 [Coprinellus micaceus]